jgi:hypothetical protein
MCRVVERAAPEFDCTDTVNVPFPVPDVFDSVTHGGAPVTDHAHPVPVATAIGVAPPAAVTLTFPGVTE